MIFLECVRHPWFYFQLNAKLFKAIRSSPVLQPVQLTWYKDSPERKFFQRSRGKRSCTFKESTSDPYQQKQEMVHYTKIKSQIGKEIHIHRKITKTFSLSYQLTKEEK